MTGSVAHLLAIRRDDVQPLLGSTRLRLEASNRLAGTRPSRMGPIAQWRDAAPTASAERHSLPIDVDHPAVFIHDREVAANQ